MGEKKKQVSRQFTLFFRFNSKEDIIGNLKQDYSRFKKTFDEMTSDYYLDSIYTKYNEHGMEYNDKLFLSTKSNNHEWKMNLSNKDENFELNIEEFQLRFFKIFQLGKDQDATYLASFTIHTFDEYNTQNINDLKNQIYKENAYGSKVYLNGNYPEKRNISIKIGKENMPLFGKKRENLAQNVYSLIQNVFGFEIGNFDTSKVRFIYENSMLVSSGILNAGFELDKIDYVNLENNFKHDDGENHPGGKVIDEFLTLQNVDESIGGLCVQNTKMKIDEFERCSYWRWTNYGSMFIYNRTNFINTIETDGEFQTALMKYQRLIYFEMFYLVQMQRSLLNITHELIMEKSDEELNLEFCKKYFENVNTYLYRNITIEMQGIELYNELKKVCELKELETAINEDVNTVLNKLNIESTNLVNSTVDNLTRESNLIAYASLIFAVMALITALPSGYATAIGKEFRTIVKDIYFDLLIWTVFGFGAAILIYMVTRSIIRETVENETEDN